MIKRWKNVRFVSVPDLGYPEGAAACTGCIFAKPDYAECPPTDVDDCDGERSICIRPSKKAAKEYMLLKTKIRLGLGADYD